MIELPTYLYIMLLTASMSTIGIFLFCAIPRSQMSLYRYRLWRVRDHVADKLYLNREVSGEDYVEGIKLVREIEMMILLLPAINLGLLIWFIPVFLLRKEKSKSEYLNQEWKRIENEVNLIVAKKMILGSLSGWLFVVVFCPISILVKGTLFLIRTVRTGNWGRFKGFLSLNAWQRLALPAFVISALALSIQSQIDSKFEELSVNHCY